MDFKLSSGGRLSFPNLFIKGLVEENIACISSKIFISYGDILDCIVCKEIIMMGLPPSSLSWKDRGPHLSVEEFHKKWQTALMEKDSQTILLDVRN